MQPPSLPATETWGHCPFPNADMGPGLGAWADNGNGKQGPLEGQALEGSEGDPEPLAEKWQLWSQEDCRGHAPLGHPSRVEIPPILRDLPQRLDTEETA